MDEHLLNLPEEFRFRISDAIESYDQQFNDSTLNQFIDLLFECATSNLDYFEPIYQICKLQVEKESNGNNEGKFLKKFDSHVETLLHSFFENSENSENCAAASMKIYFLAFLSVQKFWLYDITFDRIKKLMSPVGCNCPEHCYVKDCANGTALRAEELRLKEHSIQCGILYLISITPLLLRNIEYYIYWCSRLRKYKHCFGNVTQDMIGQLETCFECIGKGAQSVLNEIGSLEKTDEDIDIEINRLMIEKEKNAKRSSEELLKLQKIMKVQLEENPEINEFNLRIQEINKSISETRIRCPKVLQIQKTYSEILKTNQTELFDSIKSNIDKLLKIHPKSQEIWAMKLEILENAKTIEDYREKIEERILIIERNPNILMEDLGKEIEKLPSDEFMEKLRKLMGENNLPF